MTRTRQNTAAAALDSFLGATLYETFVRDPIEADLDDGYVYAEPHESGAIRVWVCATDEEGNPTDEVLVERFLLVREVPGPTSHMDTPTHPKPGVEP